MIDVTVYADGQPHYFSYVYSGFFELAHQKRINLELTYPWSRGINVPTHGDVTLWMTVKESGSNHSHKIVIDLHDKSNYFIMQRLERCDWYFKRSYFQEDINQLPQNLIHKVLPFGLIFKYRGNHDKATIKRILGHYFSNYFNYRDPLSSAKHFSTSLSFLKAIFASPRIQEFEGTLDDHLDSSIFFQTRVWPLNKSADDVHQVNEQRVAIIRALKDAFGPKFIGGLTPVQFAIKEYPDCLTSLTTDQRSFIKNGKNILIGVYSRGLHHSMALKLPEYLAATKCIVSEPFRNQLPTPLEPEKNYLEFHSPEECVTACQRILDDPQLAFQMRINNHNYYQEEVKPSIHLYNCLNQILEGK